VDLDLKGRDQVADWIECVLLAGEHGHLGVGQLQSVADSNFSIEEAQVALAVEAMKRRARWIGDAYPFEIGDGYVKLHAEAAKSPYASMLMMTPWSPADQCLDTSTEEFQTMAVWFERLTARSVEALMGPESKSLRFGYPGELGRPSNFQEAIVWLAERLQVEPGEDYKPPQRNDGGADVIGWRPFPDQRSGMLLLLVQCTLQRELMSKTADIKIAHWQGWLKLRTPPISVLAIPGNVTGFEKWEELASQATVLDRTRIAGLIPPGSLSDDFADLWDLTRDRIARLAGFLDESA